MKYEFEGQNGSIGRNAIPSAILETLPTPYITFLARTNGGSGHMYFKNEQLNVDIQVFYSSDTLASKAEIFSDRLDTTAFVPIASTMAGDQVCINAIDDSICLWCHDTGERIFLASTFPQFWDSLKVRVRIEEYNKINWMQLPQDWTDSCGRSICECAAIEGHIDVVKFCIQEDYPTGLVMHYAAMNGRFDIVDLLIHEGFDINALDSNGKSPLDWAAWKKSNIPQLEARGARRGRL